MSALPPSSEQRPLLKEEVLGDRTQGYAWQVLQERDDSNHAEEETDEQGAVRR